MKWSFGGHVTVLFVVTLGCFSLVADSTAQQGVRARDLGIWFDGEPGPFNAITDVDGVRVGHTTLIDGDGDLVVGEGPIRTGVTVIFPRGDASDPVFAGWFALNGNGEMTGTTWVKESGFLEGPIGITNTHSVGVVRDAIIGWQAQTGALFQPWSLPVVAETYDGFLNDINGFHVRPAHVFAALDGATSGPVAEGGVGGGTGMICYGFKGGIGTASRRLADNAGGYTVGVLVQANFGGRALLRIDGVPVGRELVAYGRDAALDAPLNASLNAPLSAPQAGAAGASGPFPFDPFAGDGSIIIVVATDAPLLSHQLERLARRASLGVARTGGISSNGSGDIFVAFSTANAGAAAGRGPATLQMVRNSQITPLFNATVQATEEAIINALVAAQTMVGRDGNQIVALPHDRVRELLRTYNRLQ